MRRASESLNESSHIVITVRNFDHFQGRIKTKSICCAGNEIHVSARAFGKNAYYMPLRPEGGKLIFNLFAFGFQFVHDRFSNV